MPPSTILLGSAVEMEELDIGVDEVDMHLLIEPAPKIAPAPREVKAARTSSASTDDFRTYSSSGSLSTAQQQMNILFQLCSLLHAHFRHCFSNCICSKPQLLKWRESAVQVGGHFLLNLSVRILNDFLRMYAYAINTKFFSDTCRRAGLHLLSTFALQELHLHVQFSTFSTVSQKVCSNSQASFSCGGPRF